MYSYIIHRNLSNHGTEESVVICEVSSFQGWVWYIMVGASVAYIQYYVYTIWCLYMYFANFANFESFAKFISVKILTATVQYMTSVCSRNYFNEISKKQQFVKN